jgi:hypothetical protein
MPVLFGLIWIVSGLLYGGTWVLIGSALGAAFVCLGLSVAVLSIVGRPGSLELTRDGYRITRPFGSSRFVRWGEVAEFVVFDAVTHEAVGVRYHEDGKGATRRLTTIASRIGAVSPYRLFGRRATAVDDVLPDTYGKKVRELVKLLNDWRQRPGSIS